MNQQKNFNRQQDDVYTVQQANFIQNILFQLNQINTRSEDNKVTTNNLVDYYENNKF